MIFNKKIDSLLEAFGAPTDVKTYPKVRPKGKFGTNNPGSNEPHSTASTSGFKGQSGGKMNTEYMALPKSDKGQFAGTSEDKQLVSDIFGSEEGFKIQLKKHGNVFDHKSVTVNYDPETKLHYFFIG